MCFGKAERFYELDVFHVSVVTLKFAGLRSLALTSELLSENTFFCLQMIAAS